MANETESVKIAYKTNTSIGLDKFKVLQGNLKELSEENYQKIRKEILTTGFAFAPHVWQDPAGRYWLVDGTQRITALLKMQEEGIKIPRIPIVPVQAKNLREAKRRVLQGVSQYGHLTQSGLKDFIVDSKLTIEDIKMSFDFPNIDFPEFVTEHFRDPNEESENEKEDEVPPLPIKPKVNLGDLFMLGNHRLLCGDSTDILQVEKLMNDEKADMVFTDPPYGMNLNVDYDDMFKNDASKYNFTGKRFKKVEGDNKDYDPNPIFSIIADDYFIWGADYFYDKLPSKGSWTAWDKRTNENMDKVVGNTTEFCWSKNPHRRMTARVLWSGHHGMQKDDTKTRVHPTQKPVALVEWFFDQYANKHKSIVDIYGGSGSTLIACEKTNRKCFMMELDPHYCQVIIERWTQFTNKDPERSDGVKWSKIKTKK